MSETTVTLCRIGTFYDDKLKPFHRFRYVIQTESAGPPELGEQLAFAVNKNTKRISGVGLMYSVVEVTDDKGEQSWRLGSAKYFGRWGNDADRLAWDAAQIIRDADHASLLKHAKACDDEPLQKALAPLRDLYRSNVGRNRSQLLAYFVREITK